MACGRIGYEALAELRGDADASAGIDATTDGSSGGTPPDDASGSADAPFDAVAADSALDVTATEASSGSDAGDATPRRFTRAEYDRMGELQFFRGERVELIYGTLVRMSPIRPSHSSTVGRLNELLLPRLLGRATVRIQQPFVAHDDSEPEPDVAIVPKGQYSDRHPELALLVIEVAERSLTYDRETKGLLYAASGVPEYWIVDVVGQAVEVYRNPEGGRYALARRALGGESVSPSAFPDLGIVISDLGI